MRLHQSVGRWALPVIALLGTCVMLVSAAPASAAVARVSAHFSPSRVAAHIVEHDLVKITGRGGTIRKRRCESTASRAKCVLAGTVGGGAFAALIQLGRPGVNTPFTDKLVLVAPNGAHRTYHLSGTIDL